MTMARLQVILTSPAPSGIITDAVSSRLLEFCPCVKIEDIKHADANVTDANVLTPTCLGTKTTTETMKSIRRT